MRGFAGCVPRPCGTEERVCDSQHPFSRHGARPGHGVRREASAVHDGGDGLGVALRTLAMRELDALRAALGDARSPHRGVHEARKAIRRLRSILLLGRKPFRADGTAIDAGLKALATSLSALRDAHVAAETATRVRRRIEDEAARTRWATLRRQLARRRDALLRAERDADPAFATRGAQIATLADAIAALPWQALDAETVHKALERSVRRVQRAQAAAAQRSTLEQRHRWRRRLRRLRMQWSALRPLRKHASAPVAASARALTGWLRDHAGDLAELSQAADALGREQDLYLLQQALRRLPQTSATRAALAELRVLRNEAAARRRGR